jgi:hypothetical protein
MPRLTTDICCVEGCDLPRRPAGGGRSRFCQKHHHLYYIKADPAKMERKRLNERERQRRIKAGLHTPKSSTE